MQDGRSGRIRPVREVQSTGAQPLIERARRILLHEQRTGHNDAAVKPGGLETFIARWAEEMRTARQQGDLGAHAADGIPPEDVIARLIGGYRDLDGMQRAAKLRAALALLEGINGAPASSPA